jgi:ABC-type transport system involved in multi-copper enzyme maturation permease subunit
MQLNPIIARDLRTRWRRWHGFALLCGYVILLSAAMCWLYADFVRRQWPTRTFGEMVQTGGHELFLALTGMQTLGWMIMAPALTATSIAGEREGGLLDALHMSPLRPHQIVFGKLLPALLFVVVMTLVVMPVVSICFLMGGVSPGEFGWALAMHGVTALTGASIGIYFSARSRRALGALTMAFIFVAIWGFGSLWLFEEYSLPWRWWRSTSPTWWAIVLGMVGWSNPVLASLAIVEPSQLGSRGAAGSTLLFADYPYWSISFAFQMTLSILLLWSATRVLRKPLPDLMLSDRRWTDRWKARLAEHKAASEAARQEERARRLAQRAGSVLLWDLPLAGFIRFANPILQREVRGQFRWRRGSLWVTLLQTWLALGGMCVFIFAAYSALDSTTRAYSWWVLSYLMLVLFIVTAAMIGARSFTREREAGTWNGLYLSLLSPREILAGKVLAPLIGCTYYSLPLWPIMAVCVDYTRWSHARDGFGNYSPSVSLSQATATLCILAAAGWCYAAWGMLISRLCRHTASATAWTLATLLVALVGVPFLLESLGLDEKFYGMLLRTNSSYWHVWRLVPLFLRLWHPVFAMASLHTAPYSYIGPYYYGDNLFTPAAAGFISAGVLFIIGWVLLAVLHFLLRHAAFEETRRRG